MVEKNTIEKVRFLWLAAITSAGGLTFTLAYALIIFMIREQPSLLLDNSLLGLLGFLVVMPAIFAIFGMISYHSSYKSFKGKQELDSVVYIDNIISKRFSPRRQLFGLIVILVFLLVSVVGVIFNYAPLFVYYALIMTALSYMITIIVYNSTIAYIAISDIDNDSWPEDCEKSLYYNLYCKDKGD